MLPSLLKRLRAPAPPVPPVLDRAAFDTAEAHRAYMQERRRAQERLREFNRPQRDRSGRDQSNRTQSGRNQSGRARHSRVRAQTMREAARAEAGRRINHRVSVHVGRKCMVSVFCSGCAPKLATAPASTMRCCPDTSCAASATATRLRYGQHFRAAFVAVRAWHRPAPPL